MAEPICPACGRAFEPQEIDVAAGAATCPACDRGWSLGVLAGFGTNERVEMPAGCQMFDDLDARVIECRMQSGVPAIIVGIFACVWNVFLWTAFMPRSISAAFHATDTTSLLMSLLFLLFCLPFVVVGIAVAGFAVLLRWGRTTIRLGRSEGEVFIGVGQIGWKRRFDPSQVTEVRESVRAHRDDKGRTRTTRRIELVGPGKPLVIGAPEDTMHVWLLQTLRSELLKR